MQPLTAISANAASFVPKRRRRCRKRHRTPPPAPSDVCIYKGITATEWHTHSCDSSAHLPWWRRLRPLASDDGIGPSRSTVPNALWRETRRSDIARLDDTMSSSSPEGPGSIIWSYKQDLQCYQVEAGNRIRVTSLGPNPLLSVLRYCTKVPQVCNYPEG